MIIADTDYAKSNYFSHVDYEIMWEKCFSLLEVVVTVADLCNRKCSFCPRGAGYSSPHQTKFISLDCVEQLCASLGVDYFGVFSLCGFGEPTMHAKLSSIVELILKRCPSSTIWITTNGDNINVLQNIPNSSHVVIRCSLYEYDCSKLKSLDALPHNIIVKAMCEVPTTDEFGLQTHLDMVNNRASNVQHGNAALPISRCCSIPFYKMSIDVNGDVLPCCSDWVRTTVFGNVMYENTLSIWNNRKYREFRMKLLNEDRCGQLCETCNAHGMLAGTKSTALWKKYYQETCVL